MASTAAFDALALEYDARFTHTVLGRVLRSGVWRWLDRAFQSGSRVLELNCGTGEDAIHLAQRGVRVLATDSSATMLELARAKVQDMGLAAAIELRQVPIEDLGQLSPGAGMLDGAFSSFGGLNCVPDLPYVAERLATLVRPGGRVVLCVMGPYVPWEWAWFLARGQPRRAFRRLGRRGVEWRGMSVRYPSLRVVRRAFAPHFGVRNRGGLGVLLPPTYAEPWARSHPQLLGRLASLERRIESWPGIPWLGDHYLVELYRR